MKNNYSFILITILVILVICLLSYFLLKKRSSTQSESYIGENEKETRIRLIDSARRIDSPYQIDPITQIIPSFLETEDVVSLARANRSLLGMMRERATLTPDWFLIENKQELINLLQTILQRTRSERSIPRQKYKIIIDRFYNFTEEDPLELIKIYNTNITSVRLINWDGPILGDLFPRSCEYLELPDYFLRENDTLDLGLSGIDYIRSIKLSWNLYGKLEIPFNCALEDLDMSWCPEGRDGYNWPITMSSRLNRLVLPQKTSNNFAVINIDLLNPYLERLEIGESIVRLPRNLKVGTLKVFMYGIRTLYKNRSLEELMRIDLISEGNSQAKIRSIQEEINNRRKLIEFLEWVQTINYDKLEFKLSWKAPENTYRLINLNGKETITLNIEP